MFSFRKANIPPGLSLDDIMASQVGLEGRFKSRFTKYAGTSETFNKSVDLTGQAIEDLRVSSGMIAEQKKGVDQLFMKAERAIVGISNLERESGKRQADNIPLPTDVVRSSYGKKMGYVNLTLEFLMEGLLHFMEETMNLEEALESRDRVISQLAAHVPRVEIIGAMEGIEVADLIPSAPAVDIPTYVKPEKNADSGKKTNGKKK